MIPRPNEEIFLEDIPRYVRMAFSQNVSRVTAWNWVKRGRKGVKLKLLPYKRRRCEQGGVPAVLTTSDYINEFILETTEWR